MASPTPTAAARSRLLIAGLGVLVALACAACGSSSDRHSGQPRHVARAATSASTATPTTATATVSTSTATASVSTSTTTATLPGRGRPTITIGDKNYTEQFVLGQLYVQALEAQGFTVDVTQNIGPAGVTQQALRTGALTMYPEYLDVFNSEIAGYRHRFPTRRRAYRAAWHWARPHGLSLLSPTPFADTDAIAVTVGYAATNHVRAIGDLARVAAPLQIGGAAQFRLAAAGLPALRSVYGLAPTAFRALSVGAQYAALDDGRVQAAYVNSTDGQLASGDYRLLDDRRGIFGWGNVVPVVSARALAREGPAFPTTIERVDATLSTGAMRQLNWAVDIADQSPTAVAKQFLQTHGLLTPLPGYTLGG